MSNEVILLLEVLRTSPNGLTRPELLDRLRQRFPQLQPNDVERIIEKAGDAVGEVDGRLLVTGEREEELDELADGPPMRRFVVFDLESIVRPIVKDPYKEQHVFQIGAVRFGPDAAWVSETEELCAFTELRKPEDEALIYNDELRARYEAEKRPLGEVLEEFRAFCEGADALVAYNGVGHDFPLLALEYERARLAPLLDPVRQRFGPRLVDGLYLAQALWPIPPRQHRLKELLERLEVDIEEMQWHDALDDSKMVVLLLEEGANDFLPTLGELLISLLASAGAGSDAWELLLTLAGLGHEARPYSANEVAQVLHGALEAKTEKAPLRPEPPPEPEEGEEVELPIVEPVAISIPPDIRGAGGEVDIDKLVAVAAAFRGVQPEERPPQRVMVEQIRAWLTGGRPALVEAPTGTGKSYAILAAALDWLAADRESKVVISTFTKQLQSQLAEDIQLLTDSVMPELAQAADMVKGAANRLSLRALVLALADLTELDPRRHRRGRQDFTDDQRYRDLIIYLALRFIAEGKPAEEWEARSVDRVDVPAFFDDYCPRRLTLYLASLAQSENEDYPASRGGIGRYTQTVREALESRRLVVANHALLLAHLDDFEELGERTLLFVDEAHELENAATTALSPEFDSALLAEIVKSARDWIVDQAETDPIRHLSEAVTSLDLYLEDERLATAALKAFDTAERDPLGRNVLRTVTVANPLEGDASVVPKEHLAHELRTTVNHVGGVRGALRGVEEPADPFEADRLNSLRARVSELDDALRKIVDGVNAVFTPVAPATAATTEGEADSTTSAAGDEPAADESDLVEVVEEIDGEEQIDELIAVDAAEEEAMVEDDETLAAEPDGEDAFAESRPNRVVFAEELDEYRPGRTRYYRFRVASAPIELGREPDWRAFRARFARAYYVSATLRVADSWEFIRRRLAMPESEVEAIALGSPFDHATQAELVCFSDFPSWAEHEQAAMHTVAHQIAGYAKQLVDDGDNGAMVLTTSRAASAGIFDWLARMRVRGGESYPLISAGIEGNQRAVETFKKVGGVLVGTRGLWQGVDIAKPASRLRLVWVNKLPFAPFADPVIAARIALEREQAELRGEHDAESWATEHYYLPLAALALRQAVGRLVRTRDHRGVIIVSDRKLAGPTRLRRLYRQVFLGSLDSGLMRVDAETGEEWLGNVMTMQDGWKRIFDFFAREAVLDADLAEDLSQPKRLLEFTELPETLEIGRAQLSEEAVAQLAADGRLGEVLLERCEHIALQLNPERGEFHLKGKQAEAITALAEDKDLLAVLPTGYGKSYVFQLPALALPGVTIVVSPLVSLMTDQAIELNRTIGGRVRALVAPMRESNSRTGKSEVEEELRGRRSHGIKLVYLSPERLCQRHFQEWLRAGVANGVIRRIALDEAHTFVQWGDDFRPSVRRAENFVRELKHDHPELRLMALTATANDTVYEGIRRGLFGLKAGETRDDFAFVAANPLRPELAIYRRTLPRHQGGASSVAALVESVVDKIDGHAIFYCLAVRQVEALYAHLTDYLEGHPVDILMYHGRLPDGEKTGIANHFKSAPRKDEDGYRRMVVVATSAFGLGIDRPDIRAVFCVSPPTDLAALYQQLGRAGRDRAARPEEGGGYTAGLALMYPRADRTISFMTQQRVGDDLLARMAGLVLTSDSPLSAKELARTLIDEDLRHGKLRLDDAASEETLDTYATGVYRVVADLHQREVLDDLGDFPQKIEIRPGEYAADTPELLEVVDAVLAEVRPGRVIEVARLHERMNGRFADDYPDPGALWASLLELHTLGYLDVSQRPNRDQLTAVSFRSHEVPSELVSGLSRRRAAVLTEAALLRGWFGERRCCNEGFRTYFRATALPTGTCASDDCRCSACWNKAGLPAAAAEPPLYEAFCADKLVSASATARGRKRSADKLDKLVYTLLWHNYAGLVENIIWSVLRGDDHFYSRSAGKRKPLWPKLLNTRVRGRKPGLRKPELRASLARLLERGDVVEANRRFRLARYQLADEARRVAEEAEAAGGDGRRAAESEAIA